MILQSLVDYYENLIANDSAGEIPRRGWSNAKVSYALQLDSEGNVVYVVPLLEKIEGGKKEREIPQTRIVPEQKKRSSGIQPQFLCDTSSYMLGVDNKGKKEDDEKSNYKEERAKQCLKVSAEYHNKILEKCVSPAAEAIKKYFDKITNYEDDLRKHPYIGEFYDVLTSGGNIVFRFDGKLIHEFEEIRSAWSNYFENNITGDQGTCLVTGTKASIARLHPSIKGVLGAQSSGASLVSFNAPAYESYGNNGGQGLNAPVSEYAAFAYGTALNHLLADTSHKGVVDDTTFVCWAEEKEEYSGFINNILCGSDDEDVVFEDKGIQKVLECITQNKHIDFDSVNIQYSNNFYMLGLSPNSARLSVRMFYKNSFGNILKNIEAHFNRLNIVRPIYERSNYITLKQILRETINKKSSKAKPSQLLSGGLMNAILSNSKYPANLFQDIVRRIKAEQGYVNYRRAAILKAYLIKNYENIYKDVIKVEVNKETNNIPFVLGRLFAVLEHAQTNVNGDLNATIRDKYFNTAAATPARIFPIIINLYNHHLKKMSTGSKIFHEKLVSECMGKITESKLELPRILKLEEQGVFMLGYYQQRQELFKKNKGDEE